MKTHIMRRIVASVLTTLVFVSIVGVVMANESYGFWFYFLAFSIYGGPAIFLVGLPFSIVIDKLMYRIQIKNKTLRISASTFLYAFAGFLGTYVFFWILAKLEEQPLRVEETLPFTIFGVLAALIFYVCHNVVNYAAGRRGK